MTATATDELYNETTVLKPNERIDLKPYRIESNIVLSVTVESNVVFEDNVEPQEGHTITIVSKTEVEVDTVVE